MSSEIKVLITGFGPFLDIKNNPSHQITLHLARSLTSANNTPIRLITPASYIPAAYHKIHTQAVSLIEQHNPDIVLHIGLAVDRDYFAIEQSAQREGYHEIPDVDRKVVTRSENKTWFGNKNQCPDTLASDLELERVVQGWEGYCRDVCMLDGNAKGKGKEKSGKGAKGRRRVDVRLSDDVGTYVCGFLYYVSLLEMRKRKGKGDVLFLHVPPLEGEEEVGVGGKVVEGLVRAVVDVWEER